MAPARKTLHLEISDIMEPEQEDAVIRALEGMGRSGEELRERFRTTDTCVVKDLSPDTARALADDLRAHGLEVRTIDPRKQESPPDPGSARCPRCGHLLEFADWRCPECYYEFEDYRFEDDQETHDTRYG